MFARPMKGRSLSSVKLDAVMLVHYGPVTKKLSFLNNKAARCVYNAPVTAALSRITAKRGSTVQTLPRLNRVDLRKRGTAHFLYGF